MAAIILCEVMRYLAATALALFALSPAPAAAALPAAPAVRMPLLKDGETFDSRALIGKKVLVLRFQASWCKICAGQAAGLQRVYDRYKERDVEILAIHVDDTEPDARAFVAAHRATYPVALDPGLRVANRFGFKRAPYTVVVNKRGEIAARLDATADLARLALAIDAALKPPARRKAPARAS
jgi:peroxiredoxin